MKHLVRFLTAYLRTNASLRGWKCQVQVTTDSVSFQDPAAGRRVLRHERIASWNNGIKVISVSSALLS